jgi:putative Holliday junction resolvase
VRVLGVDLGERRIGVAVSDGSGTLASPWGTIDRRADARQALEALADVAVRLSVERVVVGLPLSLDGRRRRAARAAQEEADALAEILEPRAIAVETFDERLTTVSAERALARAGRRGARRRAVVDQAAAAVLLQAWLDGRGPGRG